MTNPLGCLDCPVKDSAVCAMLPHDERERLARSGQRRIYERGGTVVLTGDTDTPCASLISGVLKLSRFDIEGTERTVAIVHPSGFLARLFTAPAECTVTALTRSELCLFPREAMMREMRAHPDFMERVLRATNEQLDASRDLIDLIGRRQARARVAGYLLMMLEGCGAKRDGIVVDLVLTRGEIASLLGLTIETVSRQLGSLEGEGIIRREGRHAIVVPALARLRDAAR